MNRFPMEWVNTGPEVRIPPIPEAASPAHMLQRGDLVRVVDGPACQGVAEAVAKVLAEFPFVLPIMPSSEIPVTEWAKAEARLNLLKIEKEFADDPILR